MPKVHVRGDKLTVTIPTRIREAVAVHDGDEMEVSAEAVRRGKQGERRASIWMRKCRRMRDGGRA